MKKKNIIILSLVALTTLALGVLTVQAKRGGLGGRGDGPVIYVESQGLYFDSIVTADPLPFNGHNGHSFSKLYMGPNGLTTMYGPGDPESKGGRWWLDLNGNDVMDPEGIDHYFNCPLLGPGRLTP